MLMESSFLLSEDVSEDVMEATRAAWISALVATVATEAAWEYTLVKESAAEAKPLD